MPREQVRTVVMPALEQEAQAAREAAIEKLAALLRSGDVTDQQIMWLAGLVASWLEPIAEYENMIHLQRLQHETAQGLLLPAGLLD